MTIRVERLRVRTMPVHLDIARYFPAFIMTGYGAFILSLFIRNALTLYINPNYVWPTTVAGGILLTLGLHKLVRRTKVTACCSQDAGCSDDGCGCGEPATRLWPYAALCIPLFLAVLLPPRSLSAFSAQQRGMQIAGQSMIRSSAVVSHVSLSVDTRSFGFQDWVAALGADPNPKDYRGKPVILTGMVMHAPASVPPGYIMVLRYQITCCVADARPEGLVVRDTWKGALKDGEWVSVRGVMGEANYQGQQVAVVEPKQMVPTKAGNPYMY